MHSMIMAFLDGGDDMLVIEVHRPLDEKALVEPAEQDLVEKLVERRLSDGGVAVHQIADGLRQLAIVAVGQADNLHGDVGGELEAHLVEHARTLALKLGDELVHGRVHQRTVSRHDGLGREVARNRSAALAMPFAVQEKERFMIRIVEIRRRYARTTLIDARRPQQFAGEREVAFDPVGLERLQVLGNEARGLAVVPPRQAARYCIACVHTRHSRPS
jgi:hypothetical protein